LEWKGRRELIIKSRRITGLSPNVRVPHESVGSYRAYDIGGSGGAPVLPPVGAFARIVKQGPIRGQRRVPVVSEAL